MTTAEIIVLSSSPAPSTISITPRPVQFAQMSSSPGLPSPSILMKLEKSSLPGGYCAVQLSEKSVGGFAPAVSLTKVGASGLDQTTQNGEHSASRLLFPAPEIVRVDPEPPMKPKPRKRVPTGGKGAVAPKKARASSKAADKLTEDGNEIGKDRILQGLQDSVMDKKPRKPRVKKDKVEGQPKIKKGKITKPGTEDGKEETLIKRKRSTFISGTVEPAGSTGSADVVELPPAEQNLGLDKALMRRKCWTPPKETGQIVTGACENTGSTVRSVEPPPITAVQPSLKTFGSLLSSFGFAQEPESRVVPQVARECDGVVLTKRRKIELEDVAVQSMTMATVSKRSKSPKKKPVTITEKATAQYVAKDPNPAAPLLQYFVPQDSAGSGGCQVIDNKDTTKAKNPTKPAKATSANRKAKKGTAALPLLLSPESALKKVSDQDILFGTSSQLAEEESPTYLRELQQALNVSEISSKEDSFIDSAYGGETPTKPKASKGLTCARVSSGRLWASATRDFEGNLLDAEVINLAHSSPVATGSKDTNPRTKSAKELQALPMERDKNNTWMVLDDRNTTESNKDRAAKQSGEQESTQSNDQLITPSHSKEVSLEKGLKGKSLARKKTKTKSKITTVQSSQNIQTPEYGGYPTAKLAIELASYGFKPIKNRDQMIALLEKCWEGKSRVALQSLTTNANRLTSGPPSTRGVAEADNDVEKPQSRSKSGKASSLEALHPAEPAQGAGPVPKKPRGRPRKPTTAELSTGATQQPEETRAKTASPSPKTQKPTTAKRKATPATTVEEISDSDTPLTPSPPRRRSSRSSFTTPRPLNLRPASAAESTPSLSPAAAQTQLFANITKAITTFPRSTNPKHPTWHEKILMYDPIVLEDLAYWLNTEGLGRVGVDEEVGPGLVKAWCEAKSVCCLWRENLRGGGRARH